MAATKRAKPKTRPKAKPKPKPKPEPKATPPTAALAAYAGRFTPVAMDWLAKVDAHCRALPNVTQRPSHGAPTYFAGKRTFAYFVENHHGDGKLAVICAAPAGFQAMILEASPEAYYRPAYVGHLGWIGVRLDRDLAWEEVMTVLDQAHQTASAKK
jgi:hypothetical protein